MNNVPNLTNSPAAAPGINPFARALAEARGGQGQGEQNQLGMDQSEQQRQLLEKQKKERLRAQLHRQINPVEERDIFNAREQQVKKQIDEVRYELKLLSKELEGFEKDVEISIMSNVPSPGDEGKYYFSFFQKLKQFIILLRNKIHSARTWATTFSAKKKKRQAMGMEISGKSYEQTATVFDRMHHERSTQYAGS